MTPRKTNGKEDVIPGEIIGRLVVLNQGEFDSRGSNWIEYDSQGECNSKEYVSQQGE